MANDKEIRFGFCADTKELEKAFDTAKQGLEETKKQSIEKAKIEAENAKLELKYSKKRGKAYDQELLKINRTLREKITAATTSYNREMALLRQDKQARSQALKQERQEESQRAKEEQDNIKETRRLRDYLYRESLRNLRRQHNEEQRANQVNRENIQNIKKLLKKLNINISDEQASQLQQLGAIAGKAGIIVGIVGALASAYKNVTSYVDKLSLTIRTTLYNGIKTILTTTINLFSQLEQVLTAIAKLLYELAGYGGDLEAANNMIASSFGKMTSEVDAFISTCGESYGLTETMAKKTAGLFMTMSNAMGIANKDGQAMALTLTGLSGDLASFYNTSQDNVMLALKSVYTGETETLKQYGIVLTEANLEQYMLNKNIKASYQELTQAEKVLLRYNYILETTTDIQGNFKKTNDSFVTSTKSLGTEWKKLLQILGESAVKVLTPLIGILSAIIVKLQDMASVLSILITEIFALNSAFGVVGDTSLYDWNEEVSNAKSGVSDIKEELSSLAGIDTINVLQSPKEDSSSSGSGSGSGILGNLGVPSLYDTGIVEGKKFKRADFKWIEDILNWIKERINNAKNSFKNAFSGINFEELQSKMKPFVEQLGVFIDWLIEKGAIVAAWFTDKILPKLIEIGGVLLEIIPLIVNSINWDSLGAKIESLLTFINEKLQQFKTWCEENPEQLSYIVNLIISIVGYIGFILPLILRIAPILAGIQSIIAIFVPMLGLVASAVGIILSLFNLWKTYMEWLGPIAYNLGQSIKSAFETAFIAGKQLVSDFISDVISGFSYVANFIANIFNNIPNLIRTGLNLAISLINTVLQSINQLKFDIPNWVPEIGGKSFGFNMPKIPQLESGSVLSQPSIARTSNNDFAKTLGNQNNSTVDNTSQFNQMIGLLQGILEKDNNTYIDGKALYKNNTKYSTSESWRRGTT